MSVVYDAGVLIAAERDDREVWADHRARLEFGVAPTTTAPVVAQVSRSPRQAQLRLLLRGCDIVGFSPEQAHPVGKLLADAGASDVVDAHVVLTADRTRATVLTSDREDLKRLSNSLARPVPIQPLGRPPRPRRR
ncbi:MAG: PIN domain-containing protein [Acidimicrobiales bacterium]